MRRGPGEAEAEHGAAEGFVEVVIGDSEHEGHCRVWGYKRTPLEKTTAGPSTAQLAKARVASLRMTLLD